MSDDQRQAVGDEVQRLNDLEAIKQLKARYFRCVDAQDWDGWANDVLADDFHFEMPGVAKDGRDEFIAMVSKLLTGGKTVHHGHMPEIAITGPDSASGIWAMDDYVSMPGKGGAPFVMHGYGHYLEEYVRTDEGWRIKSSKLTRLRVDVFEGAPDFS
jgi:hypothetical protein